MSTTELTVLTLNCGLLRVRLFGRTLTAPTPFVEERLRLLPLAIASVEADVVCLQEIYEDAHHAAIAGALRDRYPYAAFGGRGGIASMHSGLMMLSKHRLLAPHFVRFRRHTVFEGLFGEKGFLTARIVPWGFGPVTVMDIHATAGGFDMKPEARDVEEIRQSQFEDLHRFASGEDGAVIAAGDWNAGDGASTGNYDWLLAQRYCDALAIVEGRRRRTPGVTWDPKNALNAGGPHGHCPPQRIDHVFLREGEEPMLDIAKARIVLAEPMIALAGRGRVTVSDHAGVSASFVRRDVHMTVRRVA